MIVGTLIGLLAVVVFLICRFRRNYDRPRVEQLITHTCGVSNPQNANFCRNCGEPLAIDLVEGFVPEKS